MSDVWGKESLESELSTVSDSKLSLTKVSNCTTLRRSTKFTEQGHLLINCGNINLSVPTCHISKGGFFSCKSGTCFANKREKGSLSSPMGGFICSF
ncbi:hypothetical protein CDAR_600641 [Caerostris darwini]|uniref:Uncharacterized protein n=1 Tax=Caerostris darwini TaxID=1538125 RepID=A0AAV4TWY2_9ARAC|nr:hypothetical protein CDAR_600641 [Caerostris darwini]